MISFYNLKIIKAKDFIIFVIYKKFRLHYKLNTDIMENKRLIYRSQLCF